MKKRLINYYGEFDKDLYKKYFTKERLPIEAKIEVSKPSKFQPNEVTYNIDVYEEHEDMMTKFFNYICSENKDYDFNVEITKPDSTIYACNYDGEFGYSSIEEN